MSGQNLYHDWDSSPEVAVLHQVVDLLSKVTRLDIMIDSGNKSFYSKKNEKAVKGIQSISGETSADSSILVKFELVSFSEDVRISSEAFVNALSELGEKIHFIPPIENKKAGKHSLWIALGVQAKLMSMSRTGMFMDEIRKIENLAITLQDEIPESATDSDLVEKYNKVAEVLSPVFPLNDKHYKLSDETTKWITKTVDYLLSGLPVALVASYPVQEDYMLSAIALYVKSLGNSIGRITVPTVNAKGLIEIGDKAPGIVAARSSSITMGTNIYEISNDVQNVLTHISKTGKSYLFTGTYSDHQTVFHGGQGGASNPQLPVIRHIPKNISLENLLNFSLDISAGTIGGIPKNEKSKLFAKLYENFKDRSFSLQMKIMDAVTTREVNLWVKNRKVKSVSTGVFISNVENLSETFSGINDKQIDGRTAHVQDKFTEILTDPGLLTYFTDNLVAQDTALDQLVSKLVEEVLTRPLHQPIRYCAQGTPATGKSESAALLAKRLGVPFINIDAAGIPDFYTASAQLLGSGRGIVGSNKSGRLEEASKHHIGAVVEVSDLDHAAPQVRSSLGDLFLQILGTGNAQSATGAMFSCANLIFAFTINLPEGKDENLRKPGIGFNNIPSQKDIRHSVVKEVKAIFSSAFLSRIGKPVLFDSLSGKALEIICERAAKAALITATARMHFDLEKIKIEKNVGKNLVKTIENVGSFGARILIDESRNKVAKAYLEFRKRSKGITSGSLIITSDKDQKIIIEIRKEVIKNEETKEKNEGG